MLSRNNLLHHLSQYIHLQLNQVTTMQKIIFPPSPPTSYWWLLRPLEAPQQFEALIDNEGNDPTEVLEDATLMGDCKTWIKPFDLDEFSIGTIGTWSTWDLNSSNILPPAYSESEATDGVGVAVTANNIIDNKVVITFLLTENAKRMSLENACSVLWAVLKKKYFHLILFQRLLMDWILLYLQMILLAKVMFLSHRTMALSWWGFTCLSFYSNSNMIVCIVNSLVWAARCVREVFYGLGLDSGGKHLEFSFVEKCICFIGSSNSRGHWTLKTGSLYATFR